MLAQLGILTVVVGLSFWLNARLASSQLNEQYEDRALAVAQTVSVMPEVVQAAGSRTGPVSPVEPIALRMAHSTGARFIVIVNRKGILLANPNPARIGTWFDMAVDSLDGRAHARVHGTTLRSAEAAVPVFGADGTVIGQVSAGYLEREVAAAGSRVLAAIAVAAGAALLLGVLVSFVLARLLKRITFGLELDEIADLLGEVEELAIEQAALQRVATLVATGAATQEVFAAVAEEVGQLAAADTVQAYRYEPDTSVVRVAAWGAVDGGFTDGDHEQAGGPEVAALVLRTGQSARVDDAAATSEEPASAAEKRGVRSVVGIPIVVDGRVWGLIAVSTTGPEPMTAETEQRIVGFTKLAATAISNAQAHADLADSRRRVVSAADETRRKIERNLHDGSQQHLVTLSLELQDITARPDCSPELRGRLERIAEGMTSLLGELREISRGLHPAMLSHAGLRPALKSLARRAPMPVELVIDVAGRIPEPLEVAAYYVVSEALTNAAKHSGASTAQVTVAVSNDMLHVRVHDDGTGGADAARGSGLIGLRDRIEALAGTMTVDSPPRQGTSIVAEIPLTSPTPTESRPQEPVSARPPSFEPARGQCHETRNGTSVTLVPLVPQSVCPGPARAR